MKLRGIEIRTVKEDGQELLYLADLAKLTGRSSKRYRAGVAPGSVKQITDGKTYNVVDVKTAIDFVQKSKLKAFAKVKAELIDLLKDLQVKNSQQCIAAIIDEVRTKTTKQTTKAFDFFIPKEQAEKIAEIAKAYGIDKELVTKICASYEMSKKP